MSILPLIPLLRDYNKDKPHDSSVVYNMTKLDTEKVEQICRAIIALNPPYHLKVVLYENSKAMYFRCSEVPREPVSFPEIKKGAMKI